jgi:hypothetical protein
MSKFCEDQGSYAERNVYFSLTDAEALAKEVERHPEEYASYGAELDLAALHLFRASSLVKSLPKKG